MARPAEIRFLPVGDRRLAYEVSGSGPVLIAPAWWVSHLELERRDERIAGFWEALTAGFTLVRYDQLGVGTSDRDLRKDDLTLERAVAVLRAVADHVDAAEFTVLGASGGAAAAIAFAARHPERVTQLLLYGAFAHGREIASDDVRAAIVAAVRAHWGLGSRILADVFLGYADRDEQERFARFQRDAASAENAAALLELVYRLDARGDLEHVRAPTLVVHRRADRAIPCRLGRELAAAIPHAAFVPLPGSEHFPWFGDADAVVRALRARLAPSPEPLVVVSPVSAATILTRRERDVLVELARGLSDREIAEQLVVSPHTVHRHVANIRRKLGGTTRAAAVAEAARRGLL